jgi:predicted aspartyl protease
VNPPRLVSAHFPYLPLTLDLFGRLIDLEALLDMGFDGALLVPPDLVATGHPPDGVLRWTLADGSRVIAPYYVAQVRLGPLGAFPVLVTAVGNEPLLGRALTDHFTVTLDHGQHVIVEP